MTASEPPWEYFRSLLAVLREGSLSGAARSLGLSQPTLGRHIEALEHAFGVALFTRSAHGLLPTDAAMALRPHAEALEAAAAALLRAASEGRDTVAGIVRIAASEVIGAEVLPPILGALRTAHPSLVIEIALSNRLDDLLHREADIAVRMVEPRQEALMIRRVGSVALGLHAHPSYLDQVGVPASLPDLRRLLLIGPERESPFLRRLRAQGMPFELEHVALRCGSDLAQLAAIRAGVGIGVCQAPLALRSPTLMRVLPSAFEFALPIYVAMHEDLRHSRRCKATFDALAAGLARYVRGG